MAEHLRCRVCGQSKPVSNFPINRSLSRGYGYQCKACMKGYRTSEQYKEERRERQRLYAQSNPEKIKAHSLARYVPLSERCQGCGATTDLHRHHPDYSKPREVVTVCSSCHQQAHVEMASTGRKEIHIGK